METEDVREMTFRKLFARLNAASRGSLNPLPAEMRYVGDINSGMGRHFILQFLLNPQSNLFFGVQFIWGKPLSLQQMELFEQVAAQAALTLDIECGTLRSDREADVFTLAFAVEVAQPLDGSWSSYRKLIRDFTDGLDTVISLCEVAEMRNEPLRIDQMQLFTEVEINGALH